MSEEPWPTEADDAWAAERRSGIMSWLRRRFRRLGAIAGAVSHADTGPYAGAPRAPQLRVDHEKAYSTVRYAAGQVTYTSTTTGRDECPNCGERMVETHEIEYVHGDQTRVPVGALRTCRRCQADAWPSRSGMLAVRRARTAARKNVV